MSRFPRARLRAHNPHTTTITDPTVGLEPGTTATTEASIPPPAVRRRGRRQVAARVLTASTVAVALLAVPSVASADPGVSVVVAANTLPVVIANLQAWAMGILASIASLFLVLGGLFRATAGGDPAQVDKANGCFKNALSGYGLAVLAPILLEVVKGIVGG
ncbi:pilin [Dactylosporangium sp. NPDC049525]|uniref:pilin n=1 Tax=Dactylosporangium sp. NPDC049525 TaxID=3154730 RepID=UPI0034408F1A